MGDGKYRFGVWVAVIFTLLLLLPWLGAQATEAPVRLDQVGSAEMLVKTAQPGLYLPVPAVKTAIALQVRGIVARGTVHQTFENKSNHCVEAVYAFPLPENAAVDTLTMIVGNHTIEGVVQERVEAQKTYEQAKAEGTIGNCVIGGHRDTEFSALRDARPGDRIDLEAANGHTTHYLVDDLRIVDRHDTWVARNTPTPRLTLITCYPFDAVLPGGPQRYVVRASLAR